jgi:hypothetical protein
MPTKGGTAQNRIVGERFIEDTRQSILLISKSGEKSLLKAPWCRSQEIGDSESSVTQAKDKPNPTTRRAQSFESPSIGRGGAATSTDVMMATPCALSVRIATLKMYVDQSVGSRRPKSGHAVAGSIGTIRAGQQMKERRSGKARF